LKKSIDNNVNIHEQADRVDGDILSELTAEHHRTIDNARTPDFMSKGESCKWADGRIKASKFPMNHSAFSAFFILLWQPKKHGWPEQSLPNRANLS
jgi:hypothetical protein